MAKIQTPGFNLRVTTWRVRARSVLHGKASAPPGHASMPASTSTATRRPAANRAGIASRSGDSEVVAVGSGPHRGNSIFRARLVYQVGSHGIGAPPPKLLI